MQEDDLSKQHELSIAFITLVQLECHIHNATKLLKLAVTTLVYDCYMYHHVLFYVGDVQVNSCCQCVICSAVD